jgi:hypothetical protein
MYQLFTFEQRNAMSHPHSLHLFSDTFLKLFQCIYDTILMLCEVSFPNR